MDSRSLSLKLHIPPGLVVWRAGQGLDELSEAHRVAVAPLSLADRDV